MLHLRLDDNSGTVTSPVSRARVVRKLCSERGCLRKVPTRNCLDPRRFGWFSNVVLTCTLPPFVVVRAAILS